jgi:hypothetical protein
MAFAHHSIELASIAAAFGLCLVGVWAALEAQAGKATKGMGRLTRRMTTGLLAGGGVWAAGLATLGPGANLGAPGVMASALASVALAAWALTFFMRFHTMLRVIGAGAALSCAITLCHCGLVLSAAHPQTFDDVLFFAGAAILNGFCVGGFQLLVRRRSTLGRALAAGAIAVGSTASQIATQASMLPGFSVAAEPERGFATLEIFAVAVLALALLCGSAALRLATRVRVWLESSPTSRAPRLAGRASLHPAPAQSVAGPAAALGRQGLQED